MNHSKPLSTMNDQTELRNKRLQRQAAKIDMQHLRYAVAAVDHGSFRRAADALLRRQSTLSRGIRQLEEAIGVVVFDRSSGGVRATRAGQSFIRSARAILEQMDTLLINADSSGRGEAGRLAIGFYTSLSAGNLRATLPDFKKQFPQVELETVERSRTRLATGLRNGVIKYISRRATWRFPIARPRRSGVSEFWSFCPATIHWLRARSLYWTDLRDQTICSVIMIQGVNLRIS